MHVIKSKRVWPFLPYCMYLSLQPFTKPCIVSQLCLVITKRPWEPATAAGCVFPLRLGWQITTAGLTECPGMGPVDTDDWQITSTTGLSLRRFGCGNLKWRQYHGSGRIHDFIIKRRLVFPLDCAHAECPRTDVHPFNAGRVCLDRLGTAVHAHLAL